MEISTSYTLPADPLTVFTLFTDREFLEEVAHETEATSSEVSVAAGTTRTSREFPAPEQARTFTGSTLRVDEEVAWDAAADDGARTGRLTLTVKGQPAQMDGTVQLTPAEGGSHTLVNVAGDLKVKIPLVGKKIEKMAAPMVLEGIEAQQSVAQRRLAN